MSTDSIVKASNWRLVEVGRVVLVKNTGKLATIVEIIDQKKVCFKQLPYKLKWTKYRRADRKENFMNIWRWCEWKKEKKLFNHIDPEHREYYE